MIRIMLAATMLLAAPALAQENRSDADKVLDGAGNAVERPLKDVGIIPIRVNPKLQAVMDKPYDTAGLKSCASYKKEIDAMTAVLGPDVDSAAATADKNRTAAEHVAGGMEGLSGGIIPGQGLIAQVSGAASARKRVNAAILAGSVRRAYLKGVGRTKGCKV